MSASQTPSRSEVKGWSPPQLAHYLRTDLSENDLQKFPKLHAPLICKISTEISRKEERRKFFTKKTPPPKYPDAAPNALGWADDEFDDVGNSSSDDNDYVDPNSSDDNDYVDPNSDDDAADPYEDPPSEPCEDLNHLRTGSDVKLGNSDYIDNRNHHPSARPPEVLPRPLPPKPLGESRRDPSPHVHSQLIDKGHPPKPQIFRDKKPGRDSGSSPFMGASNRASEQRSSSTRPQMELPGPRTQPKTWTPAGRSAGEGQRMETVSKRRTFPLPPSHHAGPVSHGNSLPAAVKAAAAAAPPQVPSECLPRAPTSFPPDLDPRWYAGKVSRDLAEGCLRQLHKDGSYLVRDSTKQLAGQPFTLMVLYHNKVYNIQIRLQGHMFQLGTGLKVQETFPTISDIIHHYSQTPLLLIDAKNRSGGQQNQCTLSHPAGYHTASPTVWTHQ